MKKTIFLMLLTLSSFSYSIGFTQVVNPEVTDYSKLTTQFKEAVLNCGGCSRDPLTQLKDSILCQWDQDSEECKEYARCLLIHDKAVPIIESVSFVSLAWYSTEEANEKIRTALTELDVACNLNTEDVEILDESIDLDEYTNALEIINGTPLIAPLLTNPYEYAVPAMFMRGSECACSIKPRNGSCKKKGCNYVFKGKGRTRKECELNVRNQCQPRCKYSKGSNPKDPNDSCDCGHITQVPSPNCKG